MDFVEFFEDNILNEIFENKFPLKITCYTITCLYPTYTNQSLLAFVSAAALFDVKVQIWLLTTV